ncbi:MAG: NADH-quinone oxidoreductase subunit NuoF [Nitrococcus sp.]|nr:NADH-quinone oxidoreductase subunit NuoF [Nitrococcus sp.]
METPLTQNIRPDREPLDLTGYERAGGYQALRKALTDLSPQQVMDEVSASNLRGRGGAGFPTGKKWSFVPRGEDAPARKYLVVNADEMEPGTFKDRLLLEGDPHQMIEAMIVSAYAIGADTGYLFMRGEYTLAEQRLQRAIDEAREKGYLGANILDSGFSLEIYVHTSAGRYLCGEETALLNALEGKRAIPRHKPPFPQVSGLWGRPTVVNNVETLCNVQHIINCGADWFKRLAATEGGGGTKLYGASGRVRNPGCWELPLGTPLRAIIEEHAGGLLDGYHFRSCLPGGASTGFLTAEHLDLAMDYEAIGAAGSRLGTGCVTVIDDRVCMVALMHNLEHFFAQESCGWCTPCRDGLPWTKRLLGAIEAGKGEPRDLELLEMHCQFLGPGKTFCAHAPGAMMPLETALMHFREDFERHIEEQRCPWRDAAGRSAA